MMVFLIKGKYTHTKIPISNSISVKVQQQAAHICPNKLRQPVVEMNVGGGNTGISF